MPAAPKPSHAETTRARARCPRQRVGVVAKPKVKKVVRVNTSRHAPPQKGKCGAWLAEIKEQGGITRQAIIDGCVGRGLKATMYAAMTSYCRQLSLLTE